MDIETVISFLGLFGLSLAWWYLWSKLFKKIGKDWTWAFLMFLPFINFIVIIWFLVSGWPNRPRPLDRSNYKQVGKML